MESWPADTRSLSSPRQPQPQVQVQSQQGPPQAQDAAAPAPRWDFPVLDAASLGSATLVQSSDIQDHDQERERDGTRVGEGDIEGGGESRIRSGRISNRLAWRFGAQDSQREWRAYYYITTTRIPGWMGGCWLGSGLREHMLNWK